MIARPDNISIDINIIKNIKQEIAPIKNKELFLNELIQQRLQKCSKKYLDNIDIRIDRLLNSVENSDISDIMKVMNIVNRKYSDLYRSQISLYKTLKSIN